MSEFVRNSDPHESHIAAQAIMGTVDHDRLLVLKSFEESGKATYREAARNALRGTNYDTERLESLRRRGSDLKSLELIEKIGVHEGQAEFRLTEKGKELIMAP